MGINDLKIQAYSKPVSSLSNNPTQDGITAQELKERFDANANNEIKASINGIIEFLEALTGNEGIKGFKEINGKFTYTLDGETYIETGYTKAEVDNLLTSKANEADVLTRTNAEIFTPTGDYQPATKKYVDDKVVSAGAADMVQAVYDPTGKQTDMFKYADDKVAESFNTVDAKVDAHIDNNENPHNVTTKQIGAYPATGGVLGGRLGFANGKTLVEGSTAGISVIANSVENISNVSTSRILRLMCANVFTKCLFLRNATDGSYVDYILFGDHNKPTGTYTGNGSTSDRKITVGGIGDVLMVRKNLVCYFVTPNGVWHANNNTSTTGTTFVNGVLTIFKSDTVLNESGVTYNYKVL